MTDNNTSDAPSVGPALTTSPSVPTSSQISPTNTTHEPYNVTAPLIFLQTTAAQGIAGAFAFAAILITVHQVSAGGLLCVGVSGFGPPTKNRIVITQSQVYCLLVRKKNMPRLAHMWDF